MKIILSAHIDLARHVMSIKMDEEKIWREYSFY